MVRVSRMINDFFTIKESEERIIFVFIDILVSVVSHFLVP